MEAPAAVYEKYASELSAIPNPMRRTFAAQTCLLDESAAALMAALKARPSMLATDEKSIVERLQQVLGAVGIQAGYYPPPSEEELASMGSPHTLGV